MRPIGSITSLDHLDQLPDGPAARGYQPRPRASAQSAGTSIFWYARSADVDSLVVHINNVLALLQVGLR